MKSFKADGNTTPSSYVDPVSDLKNITLENAPNYIYCSFLRKATASNTNSNYLFHINKPIHLLYAASHLMKDTGMPGYHFRGPLRGYTSNTVDLRYTPTTVPTSQSTSEPATATTAPVKPTTQGEADGVSNIIFWLCELILWYGMVWYGMQVPPRAEGA